MGFGHLYETLAGPGEEAARSVSSALHNIVDGIQIPASIDQLQLIPNDVDTTISGPLVKQAPWRASARVTGSSIVLWYSAVAKTARVLISSMDIRPLPVSYGVCGALTTRVSAASFHF